MNEKRVIYTVLIIVAVISIIYLLLKDKIDRMVKKNILNVNTNTPDKEPLLFNEKVKVNHDEFIQGVRDLAIDLDINPNALMYWMDFESAGTFSPSIQNPYTKATGLIQFMPSTAISLGTTIADLAKMTNVEQLKYVRKYFSNWIQIKGKLKNWLDVYLTIFYPAAIGKPDTWALPAGVTPQNPAFDYVVKDGIITVGEIRAFFQNRIKTNVPTMYWKYFGM